ncbi:hypothetical protein [Halomonas denitrificans]|nr:hypothetical protein [Halomonas denitrificans]
MSDTVPDPVLDPAERRLVARARAAIEAGAGGDPALRMRLRNRAERYRELAKRSRLGGAAGEVEDADRRCILFESLHRALLAQCPDQSAG